MIIETLEDPQEYAKIHETVFGKQPQEIPQECIVGRRVDRTIVAFISGFWLAHNHFYIQWGGVLPEYQGVGYLRHLSDILHDHIEYDMVVQNTNSVMIRTMLKLGFTIIGVMIQQDKLYVQLKRNRHG